MDMEQRSAEAILSRLGKDATFYPQALAGQTQADSTQPPAPDNSPEGLIIRVILDRDVERTINGMQSGMMERRTEITARVQDLALARSRDRVVDHTGQSWLLSKKESDDGYLVVWSVTPAR